jgi:hypothetical protein
MYLPLPTSPHKAWLAAGFVSFTALPAYSLTEYYMLHYPVKDGGIQDHPAADPNVESLVSDYGPYSPLEGHRSFLVKLKDPSAYLSHPKVHITSMETL